MDLFTIEYITAAFLIFVRVSSMMMTAPFFSTAVFPVQVKIFFALVTSVLLYPVIPAQNVMLDVDTTFVELLFIIIQEILIGVALGLVGQLIFAALELSGSLISIQAALRFANVVDTMSQQQTAVVSNIFSMLAIIYFLVIEGDKVYIMALARSFETVPVSTAQLTEASPIFIQMATRLFINGVQIASPFLIVFFMLNLSFAIFARIMPQANIFFIALPVKVGVGLIMLVLIVPYLPVAFDMLFQSMFDYLSRVLDLIAP
ncbi:flagellar biosynthetic protein FliR [Natronogracilivirga saccharolytica]|uniref:Flagellar biosynthetic protein FliR n=1 Tax=Natronogracilivirga saccharolytica TaxID=2812953 RepID=A0A8J7S846_9BACT|nr:flagellar biosynthetic protein FliR [Natronogracilivirga saccharolytica]MBP3191951.1 flagellar biosynthetic protein FliR [Natronogracilivirga saccharolytica]